MSKFKRLHPHPIDKVEKKQGDLVNIKQPSEFDVVWVGGQYSAG